MDDFPLFSVIVVSYNAQDCIEKTITSILNQCYQNFEIIVKDGLSKDKTLDNIPNDDRISVYREKDNSIYNAMNQAIGYCNGDYCIFMNCGDCFYDDTVLERVSEKLNGKKQVCVYGNFYRDGMLKVQSGVVTQYTLYRASINHQTVFFPVNLLKSGYSYKTEFTMMADYELELNLFSNNVEYIYIDYPISIYEGKGVSESKRGIESRKLERRKILCAYFSKKQRLKYGIKYQLTLPFLRKYIKIICKRGILQKFYRLAVNIYYKKAV